MSYRIEKDTMGEVKVPADKLWGAQTERSRNNFKIGPSASMPLEIIYGFDYLKKAAAYTNCELGVLPVEKRDLIAQVCEEILEGKLNLTYPQIDKFLKNIKNIKKEFFELKEFSENYKFNNTYLQIEYFARIEDLYKVIRIIECFYEEEEYEKYNLINDYF